MGRTRFTDARRSLGEIPSLTTALLCTCGGLHSVVWQRPNVVIKWIEPGDADYHSSKTDLSPAHVGAGHETTPNAVDDSIVVGRDRRTGRLIDMNDFIQLGRFLASRLSNN